MLGAYIQGRSPTAVQRIAKRSNVIPRQRRVSMFRYQAAAPESFPEFGCAIDPFGFSPHWGGMTLSEMNRNYRLMSMEEFISPPAYNMSVLTNPLKDLERPPLTTGKREAITAKLFYSTRFMGAYDLDAAEYSSDKHPAIDYKMPMGAPIRAIAGGRVHRVDSDPSGLGTYVIIEHRLPSKETVFSIYGHMSKQHVRVGQDVAVGELIGAVGNTGHSTNPHLHLQIDRDRGVSPHTVYIPRKGASRSEIARYTMHPIEFVEKY